MSEKKESGEKSGEAFLSRWSRLKQEAKSAPQGEPRPAAPAADPGAPPELPPLDELTADSDFRGFFHPKVDEDLRRGALKKLFADPRFNVMDGLDIYIDDYSKPNPLPVAMLAQLKQAQKIIEWAREDTEANERSGRDPVAAEQPGADSAVPAELSHQGATPVAATGPSPDRMASEEQSARRADPQAADTEKS